MKVPMRRAYFDAKQMNMKQSWKNKRMSESHRNYTACGNNLFALAGKNDSSLDWTLNWNFHLKLVWGREYGTS